MWFSTCTGDSSYSTVWDSSTFMHVHTIWHGKNTGVLCYINGYTVFTLISDQNIENAVQCQPALRMVCRKVIPSNPNKCLSFFNFVIGKSSLLINVSFPSHFFIPKYKH